MDPLYLLIYLVVALMLVVGLMLSAMLYMIILLKGSLREAKKHSRIIIRLTRHLHTALVTGFLTTPAGGARPRDLSLSSTGTPPVTRGPDDTVETLTPLPRGQPSQ